MSNLFGGLFEASQKAKQDRERARKAEIRKQVAKTVAAKYNKAETPSNPEPKDESATKKMKKRSAEDEGDEWGAEEPPKKRSKQVEPASNKSVKAPVNPKSHISSLISKTSKKKKAQESSSESENSFDSDGSVLEFGSDDEASDELLNQLQNIIATGEVPDDPEEDEEGEGSESLEEAPEQLYSVFIGNLLPAVSQEDLVKLVKGVEEPTKVRVLMQDRDGRKVAVAFLDFKKEASVGKVVKKLNRTEFQGRPLQVRPANDRKLAPAPTQSESVYIRNLSFTTSEETIRKLFSPFGEILQVRLPVFSDSGKHRGYGFVDFKDSSSAKKSLSLDRKKIDGRPIIVEPAEKRQAPRSSTIKNDWAGEHLSFDE